MGRQAKLKKARREGEIPKKKEPVYNMTQSQLDAYVYNEVVKYRRSIVQEVIAKITKTMLMQCYDILNCYFGFGNQRLQKFRYYMDNVSEMICDASKDDPDFDYCQEIVSDLESRNIDVEALVTGRVDESLVNRRQDLKKFSLQASDFEDVKRGEQNGTKES